MNYIAKVAFVNNKNDKNPNFRQQVEAAIAKQAIYTLDDGGSPTTTMKAHALAALANPAAEVNRFAWYVVQDSGINTTVDGGGTVADADIQNIVDAKRAPAWSV